MHRFHAKMGLNSAPQKLNFVKAKAISKSYTLYYSCKCSCTLHIVSQPPFWLKPFYVELATPFLARNIEN